MHMHIRTCKRAHTQPHKKDLLIRNEWDILIKYINKNKTTS